MKTIAVLAVSTSSTKHKNLSNENACNNNAVAESVHYNQFCMISTAYQLAEFVFIELISI
jgi:hypothetical protein